MPLVTPFIYNAQLSSGDDRNCLSGASHNDSRHMATNARPLKTFQKMLGLIAAASPVLSGLLHMRPIQFSLKQRVPSAAWHHGLHRVMVTRACVSALARCRYLFWQKQGMILDMAHRRKVVMTDASNKGWGALCEGKPTFGSKRSRVCTSTAIYCHIDSYH